jgi:hypothetical protein
MQSMNPLKTMTTIGSHLTISREECKLFSYYTMIMQINFTCIGLIPISLDIILIQ